MSNSTRQHNFVFLRLQSHNTLPPGVRSLMRVMHPAALQRVSCRQRLPSTQCLHANIQIEAWMKSKPQTLDMENQRVWHHPAECHSHSAGISKALGKNNVYIGDGAYMHPTGCSCCTQPLALLPVPPCLPVLCLALPGVVVHTYGRAKHPSKPVSLVCFTS